MLYVPTPLVCATCLQNIGGQPYDYIDGKPVCTLYCRFEYKVYKVWKILTPTVVDPKHQHHLGVKRK